MEEYFYDVNDEGAKETEDKKLLDLAHRHATWISGFTREIYLNGFIHGYKHGKQNSK